ncbi:MAG: diguanylate cyclase response regulator [Spirochaetae bacterium HGW-Spirochaetae-6]|jgi:diguanylate cyclase (GGDEF)-like protein|nr:MAG: diguanylate cyclase response regulator [Spirochaetae bacterium HGW-Spirochaetae-6]
MKILIAEDDRIQRIALAGLLTKFGYEVEEVFNGEQALSRMLAPDAPSILILDLIMPKMGGLEVLAHIRKEMLDVKPYLIMLTAKGAKGDIIAGLDAGADDYLCKPFDPGELRARLDVGRRFLKMQGALLESKVALAHQASHDVLTGILNRRAILDQLEKESSRTKRHGEKLAVGICDLDHFKEINDKYGHQVGDEVLRECTRILGENIRPYDYLGRIGGEEFLIIVPQQADTEPLPIFERLREKIAQDKIMTRAGELRMTVSIGISCQSEGGGVDEIIDRADKALYLAKKQGRNRIENSCRSKGTDIDQG